MPHDDTPLLPPSPALEADLESFFNAKVRSVGGLALKLAPTTSGAPDRLVLLPTGQLHLVELKTSSGAVRDIQRLWHARAADIGVRVTVLRGRGEVMAWLRRSLDAAARANS